MARATLITSIRLAAFAVALLALTGVSYVPASEHWVCALAIDPSTPSNLTFFGFETVGDEIIEKANDTGALGDRHHMLRNDDLRIIFAWPSSQSLAVIDKAFHSFKVYTEGGTISADGNVEGKLSREGTCGIFQ